MYNDGAGSLDLGLGLMFWMAFLATYLFHTFMLYKVAQKCNCHDQAWWAYVPILNLFLLIKMAEKPAWWIVLYFIPIVCLYPIFMVWVRVAENSGHSGFWGILAAFPGLCTIALIVMAFTGEEPRRQRPMPPQRQQQRTPTHVG